MRYSGACTGTKKEIDNVANPNHLHITYYHYDEDTANIFTAKSVDGIRQIDIGNWAKREKLLERIRDPFNHTSSEEKLANMTFKEYNNENNKKV